jgi:hypothetical protein
MKFLDGLSDRKMSIFFFVTVTCIIIRFAKHFQHCLESNRYKFYSPRNIFIYRHYKLKKYRNLEAVF